MLLKFIERCVREEPMTLARSVAFSAEEVFRVDAKAEKDKIVIGGWESLWGFQHKGGPLVFGGGCQGATASWAYVKGETISSNCLARTHCNSHSTDLVGKGAKWTGKPHKMHITGINRQPGKCFLGAQILS